MRELESAKARFIADNHALTAAYLEQKTNKIIYVDMMHNSLGYLLRSLYISRSLAWLTGARLVALAGNPGVVRRSAALNPDDFDLELARSFGVEDVIHVPDTFEVGESSLSTLKAVHHLLADVPDGTRLSSSRLKALQAIETRDGIQFGRILQDTAMRSDLQPTLYAGERLNQVAAEVAGFDSWLSRLFSEHPPQAYVSGHIDYSPWALTMQRVMSAGGLGFYYRCDARTPLYLLRRRIGGETLNGLLRRTESLAFKAHLEGETPSMRSSCIRHNLGISISRNWRWTQQIAQTNENSWPFSGHLPSICLFTHTFTDQPNADDSVFVDHLEWLERTLAHAAAHRTYNLLIKIHPLDALFDVTGSIDRLKSEYAECTSIAFAEQEISHETIANRCVLGLTVRGTPGIEMPMRGMPMLLAGRSYYDHLPSTQFTVTEKQYFDVIERSVKVPRRNADTETAKGYAAFDRFWAAPYSAVLGSFDPYLDDGEIWAGALAHCGSAVLEIDEITRALDVALQTGDQPDGLRVSNSAAFVIR